jgi:PhoPQ-activated pathogenicity-related protein
MNSIELLNLCKEILPKSENIRISNNIFIFNYTRVRVYVFSPLNKLVINEDEDWFLNIDVRSPYFQEKEYKSIKIIPSYKRNIIEFITNETIIPLNNLLALNRQEKSIPLLKEILFRYKKITQSPSAIRKEILSEKLKKII